MAASRTFVHATLFCISFVSVTLPSITQVDGLHLQAQDPVQLDEGSSDINRIPYVFDPEGMDMIEVSEHTARTNGASKIDYLKDEPPEILGFDDIHGGVCPAGKLTSLSIDFHDVGCDFVDWDSRYDVNSIAASSLPWLHDVFFDSMHQTVRFVLNNRMLCMKGCECSSMFGPKPNISERCDKARDLSCSRTACKKLFASSSFNFWNNTFTCEFSNGDVVTSEVTQDRGHQGDWALLVRCPLPVELQNKSDARVNLVAPSSEDGRVRKLTGLPLCSSLSRRNVHHYSRSDRPHDSLAKSGGSKAFAPLSRKQFDLGVCLWLTGDQHIGNRADVKRGALWRLKEWLQHHVDVGVGHFFVYDNSQQPSLEMAQILEPYVKSGRASLVHWPQRYCRYKHECAHHYFDNPEDGIGCGDKGFFIGGAASSSFTMDLSCLQRFGEFTKSMAFFDVDEFLVPRHPHRTVQSVLADARTDVDGWKPTPILTRRCSDFKDSPSEGHVRESFSCTHDDARSNPKMIVNPDRMMIHQIHFAVRTWNMTLPVVEDLPADKLMMVHAREEIPIESWQPSDQVVKGMKHFLTTSKPE